jgi:sec-independent protein translocase protein TatC
MPWVIYQLWAFVAPGLYAHEKKLVLPLIVASVFLFFTGMAFAFFVVFPTVFGFINKFAPEGVAVMTDIDKYLSFALSTFMAFGITFEVPVIVIVLVKVGVVSVEKLREIRPYVIVGAFVVGAIFTPPDVLSQFMLAVPLWLLTNWGSARGSSSLRRGKRYRPLTRGKEYVEPTGPRPKSAANREQNPLLGRYLAGGLLLETHRCFRRFSRPAIRTCG